MKGRRRASRVHRRKQSNVIDEKCVPPAAVPGALSACSYFCAAFVTNIGALFAPRAWLLLRLRGRR